MVGFIGNLRVIARRRACLASRGRTTGSAPDDLPHFLPVIGRSFVRLLT
jgi:hypothetical protein